jgi:hypothetical protein
LIGRLARGGGVGALSPHGLRATIVTLALDAGMPQRSMRFAAHPLRARRPVPLPTKRRSNTHSPGALLDADGELHGRSAR